MQARLLAAIFIATLPMAGSAAGEQRQAQSREGVRFRAMDRNNDGVITRAEWRGSDQSFRVHDWNGDGVLSGDEIRRGGARARNEEDYDDTRRREYTDWTDEGFKGLDHDRDGRIDRSEWHYDLESFRRADRNRDGVLSRNEFLNADLNTDDDREDRFDYLDANRNGRIERSEWHGTRDAFTWLDRNNDGTLSRTEVVGEEQAEPDLFASLDMNRDERITQDEWHWSRRSFTQRDRNRDGVITRHELADVEPGAVGTSGQVFLVDASQRWTDTGLEVRAGDNVTLHAEGSIVLSTNSADVAGPDGAKSGRRAQDAPLRDQPAGALIARVGTASPVPVRQGQTITPSTSGRLFLGVNDDYLLDNRGQFRVTVSIQRR